MTGTTPTALLLHGAFEDVSIWAGVIAELQRAGIDVMAPAVPLRSLPGDARYVASVARRFDGPVMLVGHGYGGAVASVAGADAANVTSLVYVAGLVLEPGQSVVDAVAGACDPACSAALRPVEFQGPGGELAIELHLDGERYPAVFAADLPRPVAAAMAAAQRPIATRALEDEPGAAAWHALPSWYVVATADRILPPGAQRAMARLAGAHAVEVSGSHAVALSRPAAVAGVILEAARAAPSVAV
jgi:pimeloyl-ACP methyl ester carboxylesterase